MMDLKIKIMFTEEVLGSANNDQKIHDEFIASKAPDAQSREEEVAAIGVDAVVEKSKTIFPKEDGKPFIWDYQIKGFFKEACSVLQRCKGEDISKASCKLKAFKKIIDGCIFPAPRKMFIHLNGEMGDCQRPLRAQTAQGERIALANSDTVPAGSTVEFSVTVLSDAYADAVIEWLEYGRFKGLGQWRNSGKGRFVFSVLDSKGKVIGGNME